MTIRLLGPSTAQSTRLSDRSWGARARQSLRLGFPNLSDWRARAPQERSESLVDCAVEGPNKRIVIVGRSVQSELNWRIGLTRSDEISSGYAPSSKHVADEP